MKCSICNCEMTHPLISNYFGNNPYPVRTGESDRCCDDCNSKFVVPIRISLLNVPIKRQEEITKVLNETEYNVLNILFDM